MFLHRPESSGHTCRIPGGLFGVISTDYREGTVWECDCSVVWVVVHVPTHQTGSLVHMAHSEWRRETRRQRRKRLGLRWWQGEAS